MIKDRSERKRGHILYSLDPSYPPFFAARDFRIVGEAKGIIGSL